MEQNGNTQPEKPENPSPTSSNEEEVKQEEEEEAPLEQEPPPPPSASRRAPFPTLSQVDADRALARTIQEQERAYMMLRMNSQIGGGGSDIGSYFHNEDDDFNDPEADNDDPENDNANNDTNNTDSTVNNEEGHLHDSDHDEDEDDETDAFDAHVHHDDEDDEDDNLGVEFDPAVFTSDEAYARALQDAEEREMAASLFALAGIHDLAGEVVEREDHGGNSQDMWEEVDPDELSYEELLALGEVVGTESRGLSSDTIASLPSIKYKTGSNQNGSNDSCVICRLDYEDGENLTLLSCNHSYHSECINDWLKINKVCPVCSTEVSTSCHS